MMPKEEPIVDDSRLVSEIVASLRPASVLGVDSEAGAILENLAKRNVITKAVGASRRELASLEGRYDLALCLDVSVSIKDARALVGALARVTDQVLFSSALRIGESDHLLDHFVDAGFSFDMVTGPIFAMHRLLFLSKNGERKIDYAGPGLRATKSSSVSIYHQDRLQRIVEQIQLSLEEVRKAQQVTSRQTESRIAQLESRTREIQRATGEILKSRIWRTLVSAGALLLRIQNIGRRVFLWRRVVAQSGAKETFLRVVCDKPCADSGKGPGLTGLITVSGWALGSSGIRRVEVQIGQSAPIKTRYGLYRPDVAEAFPHIQNGDRSGFQATLDSNDLPNGAQTLIVRAISFAGGRTEVQIPIRIDHAGGFASDYERWIAEFEKPANAQIAAKLPLLGVTPLVSIILPVYRTPPRILEQTLNSVLGQSYPNWELCVVDDCSHTPEVDVILKRYASDKRIKVSSLAENQGISGASNEALKLASGEFVALLDHDDKLADHALAHFVEALNQNPDGDIFYSDHDHIDENGSRSDPFFKPDWSPDLLLSENYVNHLMIFRRELGLKVGGFRSEFDLSQDHDILLRMSANARKIVHIPKILYHWRTELGTVSRASGQRDRALESSRRAVADYLNAMGIAATVEPGELESRWRVRYQISGNPRVRIVIPCGGKLNLLDRCLTSIFETTEYSNYEIVILDNSQGTAVESFVQQWERVQYMDFRYRSFNFSNMNNAAARDCDAALLLFLNDDTAVINADWLTAMVELAARPEVGAVGAKLLFPDGTIQHAGAVLGLFGLCGHGFKGFNDDDRIYFDFPDVIRNVSAVTGACMMVRTELFWECGGFDAEAFPVAYQDIDLCLKLMAKGYRVLFTPHAKLYHFEAVSKKPEDKDPRETETRLFKRRWQHVIDNDPFYSPNLTRTEENYSCRKLYSPSAGI